MHITIKVSADVARTLHQRGPLIAESEEILKLAEELGISLKPLHPNADDPLLNPYFTVEVPDPGTAERVITSLRKFKGIEAAYLKPPDEMPWKQAARKHMEV